MLNEKVWATLTLTLTLAAELLGTHLVNSPSEPEEGERRDESRRGGLGPLLGDDSEPADLRVGGAAYVTGGRRRGLPKEGHDLGGDHFAG